MSSDKKVSAFPGRKSEVASAIAAVTQGPVLGGDQGTFTRKPCGSCFSWKRLADKGLNQGACMLNPPNCTVIMGPNGPVGQILVRPVVQADHEGCDQHDDGTDDDGGEEEPVKLAALG